MCPRVFVLLDFFLLDFSLCFPSLHSWLAFGKGLQSSKACILLVNELPFALPWIIQSSPSILDCFGDKKKLSKTPKLNTIWLEMIEKVLNMPIELKGNNYYSKVFKRVNYKLQNITFWVVITPPNRHIASPLAMKERKR